MNQHARPAASAPHRSIAFAPARASRTTDPDGTIRIACPAPLGDYDPSLARLFRAAVVAQPGRVFLQERAGDAWCKLTYAQARATVEREWQTARAWLFHRLTQGASDGA